MKHFNLLILVLLLSSNLLSQTYTPFPTDTAQWNCLTWAEIPGQIDLYNYTYQMRGDTSINSILYNKLYFSYSPTSATYIGGLREDTLKNIYFFPASIYLPNYGGSQFPTDTSEVLLYTFNNLVEGMVIPINSEVTTIKVLEIDSVLLENSYRKRYKIYQDNLLGYDYWIEGIGSYKDLFAPYSYEFEWNYYTLCYTDSITYYINSPNGEDSCHYWSSVNTAAAVSEKLILYPNPAKQTIRIKTDFSFNNQDLTIFDIHGTKVNNYTIINSKKTLNISLLKPGVYFIKICQKDKKYFAKFVKE